MSRRGWILFLSMGVIWGIPYLLIKVAVGGGLTPASLVLLRTSLGAAILLPIAARNGGLRRLLPYWKPILIYTVVEVSVPWGLLADAERRLASSLTGLLLGAVPLIGAVLTLILGGSDRLDLRRGLGLMVGFGGLAALVGLDIPSGELAAVGEVALVAVGYAIGPIIISRRLGEVPVVAVVAASLAVTVLLYAPAGIAQLPHHLPALGVLLSVVVLGAVCTALAFPLFFLLIGEVEPIRAQMITYVNPAVALTLGVLILGEALTAGKLIGFALILLGLLLAAGRRPGKVAAKAAATPGGLPGRTIKGGG